MVKNIGAENKGFTLIEMLIVIVIIAILMGVVLTGVGGFQASARDTRRIGDMRNAQNFLELYFAKCGRYPGDSGCSGSSPASWDALKTLMVSGAGITSSFPSPVGGKPYYYGVSSDGLRYVIGAELERDNSVLKDDVDTPGFTISNATFSCADPVYCIES